MTLHDFRYAGEYASSKLNRIRTEVANLRADALVISDPHAVAWAFNIRGSDVAHTPLPIAFAIVPPEGKPALYIDSAKLSNAVRHNLEEIANIRESADFIRELTAFGLTGKTVRLDQATAADALARIVTTSGGKVTRGADPIALMKAVKNPVEIEGAHEAHLRDGVAMTRFLAWLDREAPNGALTEIAAVEALESFRRDTGLLKDVSFPSISGAGPDGAIVHYRVTRATDRPIKPGELFLIDSGGQYEDGTTDITRTVAVGEPTAEMRERFTLVLKGHIAIARAVFPDGTTGAQLDPFARQHLWAAGLDFDHGTGHGVGSYLSVHEGPARISKLGNTPLKRGMILSNEPGYYKTGEYGIRIENLVLVVEGPKVGGRREAAQRVRDADAGADRPPPDRDVDAELRRDFLDRDLPRQGRRGADAADRRPDARLAGRSDPAARPGLMSSCSKSTRRAHSHPVILRCEAQSAEPRRMNGPEIPGRRPFEARSLRSLAPQGDGDRVCALNQQSANLL